MNSSLKSIGLLLFILFQIGNISLAEPPPAWATSYQDTVEIQATTDGSSITLHFLQDAQLEVFRREPGGELGSPVATLSAGTGSWTDTEVTPGVIYEYAARNLDEPDGNTRVWGYVRAGIEVDQTEGRGTVILVIAEDAARELESEVERLYLDLVSDGWNVEPLVVPYVSGWNGAFLAESIKEQIRTIYYEAGPDEVKALYLLGHVPQPRSGPMNSRPDGHGFLQSVPTDSYYADMDNLWTDTLNHDQDSGDGVANYPNDGIWDGDKLPTASRSLLNPASDAGVEFGFGRVDPEDTADDVGTATDLEALRRFLDKNHKFRQMDPSFYAGRNAVIREGHSDVVGMGMRDFHPMVTAGNIDFLAREDLPDPVLPNQDSDAQYSIDQGPFILYAKGDSAPLPDPGAKVVHWFGMQSNWGFWDLSQKMSSRLMDDNFAQTILWVTRMEYFMFPLGLGEVYSESIRISVNTLRNSGPYISSTTPYTGYSRSVIKGLMGDPTLGVFQVDGVENLTSSFSGSDVELTWSAPDWQPVGSPPAGTEPAGYSVYRAASETGEFTRIADRIQTLSYTDSAPAAGSNTYQVRAVYRITSGSGSLFQQSHGKFTTAGLKIADTYLAPVQVGQTLERQLTVTSGDAVPAPAGGPYTWTVNGGRLPPGITLSTDGRLQNFALIPGRFDVQVRVESTAGDVAVKDLVMNVLTAEPSLLFDYPLDEMTAGSVKDQGPYQRSTGVIGDPQPLAETGFRFDGDDAFRILDDDGRPYMTKPHFNGTGTLEVWFKAEPGSTGGVLVSKCISIEPQKREYIIRLQSDGDLEAISAYRQGVTSGVDYRDGEWHQVVWERSLEGFTFYVDGQKISETSLNGSPKQADTLIGARWEDAAQGTLTEFFDGSIRGVRLYALVLGENEVSGRYERMTGGRPEVVRSPPVLEPYTAIEIDEGTGPHTFSFQFSDPDGDAVQTVVNPQDPSQFEHVEITEFGEERFLHFTLREDVVGDVQIDLEYTDGWPGHAQTETVTIQVRDLPDPPVAVDDYFVRAPGVEATLQVVFNDTDPEGGTLTLQSVQTPDVGSTRVEGGMVVYTPPVNWTGNATFTYTVLDEDGLTDTGTVTVNMTGDPAGLPLIEYRMDESGDTAVVPNTGSLGSNADGTVVGTPVWVEGLLGNGLQLDGVSQHLFVGNPAGVTAQAFAGDYTLSMAFKADFSQQAVGTYSLVSMATGAANEIFPLAVNVEVTSSLTRMYARIGSWTYIITNNAGAYLNGLAWHSLVLHHDADGDFRVYLDGVRHVMQQVEPLEVISEDANLNIGGFPDHSGTGVIQRFPGTIDHFRFFGTALSEHALKELFYEHGDLVDMAPVITSIQSSEPSPFLVGQAVEFSMTVEDVETEDLVYYWYPWAGFQVNGNTSSPLLNVTAAQSGSGSLTGLVQDEANNFAAESLSFYVGELYQQWKDSYTWVLPGQDDLPDADPDGDGIPNLMEYYMNLHPREENVDNPMVFGLTTGVPVDGNNQYLTITFPRYRGLHNVTGSFETCLSLLDDSWGMPIGNVEEEILAAQSDQDMEMIRVKIPIGAATRLFARLMVEEIE